MAEKIFANLYTIPFGSITASYVAFRPASFPIYQIYFINLTDAPLFFSIDGSTDAFYVLPSNTGGGPLFTIPLGIDAALPELLYIKYQAAPTMGEVFIESLGNNGAAYKTSAWR